MSCLLALIAPAGDVSCYEEPHFPYSASCVRSHVAPLNSVWLLAESKEFSHTWPGHSQDHPQDSKPSTAN